MKLYLCASLILTLLCPLYVGSDHLHSNNQLSEQESINLAETIILSSNLKGTKGDEYDGYTKLNLNPKATQNETLSPKQVVVDVDVDDDEEEEEDEEEDDSISASANNNRATKTYERVVLEGSKIRISCPHAPSTITSIPSGPPETLLATIQRSKALKREKQFATDFELAKERRELEQQPIVPIAGQVKWFRNHVPLLNVNHFHHQTSLLVDPTLPPALQNKNNNNNYYEKDYPVIKITKLSPTVELKAEPASQTITSASELEGTMLQLREDQIEHNLLMNSVEHQLQLQLKHQQLLSNLGQGSSENANESSSSRLRKQANMSARSSTVRSDKLKVRTNNEQSERDDEEEEEEEKEAAKWHINEFGELVINKVSQYFAGKYTCLTHGRQSEVLLDVLLDDNDKGPERASKLANTRQVEANPKLMVASDSSTLLNDEVVEGERKSRFIDNSKLYLNFDAQEKSGNGPIESKVEVQLADSAITKLNNSNKLGQIEERKSDKTLSGRGEEDNLDRGANFGEDDKTNSAKSLFGKGHVPHKTGNEPLIPATEQKEALFPVERDDKTILQAGYIDDKDEEQGNEEELFHLDPSKSVLDEAGKKSNNGNRNISSTNLRSYLQRFTAQVVKSEIIQVADLKLIPGFLYTKQQLYCPIGRLHWNHIYPLVKPLCSSSSNSISVKLGKAKSEEFRCYHLAWRLISRIVSSQQYVGGEKEERKKSPSGHNCANTILDIVWFKDGDQLKFDKNGRERGTNLNVKLINSLQLFAEEAAGSGGGSISDSSREDEGSVGGGKVAWKGGKNGSSPKENLFESIKWTCPLRGRTIEIDGVRKDNAGRYTCALKLSILKLHQIIQNLRKLNHHVHQHQLRRQSLQQKQQNVSDLSESAVGNSSGVTFHDNDILCCDGQDEFLKMGTTTTTPTASSEVIEKQQQQQRFGKISSKLDSQVKIAMETIDLVGQNSSKSSQSEEFAGELAETNREHSLAKQIAVFEAILAGKVSRSLWLEYTNELLSKLQNPLTAIQTFSFLVAERSASSSDLWSTITEAGNAYTRRKLSDFKRLKRSLERDQQGASLSDVYAFNDKSSSSHSTITTTAASLFTTTVSLAQRPDLAETTLLPQLYDDQASKLNGFGIEQNSEEIKKHQQGNNKKLANIVNYPFPGTNISVPVELNNQIDAIDGRQANLSWEQLNGSSLMLAQFGQPGDSLMKAPGGDQQKYQSVPPTLLNNANDANFTPDLATETGTGMGTANRNVKVSASLKDFDEEREDANGELESDIGVNVGVGSNFGNGAIDIVQSESFNYVNERNLKPHHGHSNWQPRTTNANEVKVEVKEQEQESDDIGSTRTLTPSLTREKRSSMIGGNQNQNRDHLKLETKELITQRGSRGINNENQRKDIFIIAVADEDKSRDQADLILRDNLQPNGLASRHPTVIDDSENINKTISQLSDGEARERSYFGSHSGQDEKSDSYRSDEVRERGDGRSGRVSAVSVTNSISLDRVQSDTVGGPKLSIPSAVQSANVWQSSKVNDQSNPSQEDEEENDTKHDDLSLTDKSQQRLPELAPSAYHFWRPSPLEQPKESQRSTRHLNTLDYSNSESLTAINQADSSLGAPITRTNLEATSSGAEQVLAKTVNEPSQESSFESQPANYDRLDESLMWSAGQYLYMHMKALAASSMFGLEVGVEWSNERSNGSNVDLNAYSQFGGQPIESSLYPRFSKIKTPTPFATIDVISGQNLYLQCTAHALGRLPEVKWYKLIYSIPRRLKRFSKLARRIGNDLYWPLAELNLLEERDAPNIKRSGSSFTCSQSTSIFDNLENQTFTVINSLQLSQYNDRVSMEETIKPRSLVAPNYNLYACIVDADVRHNYVTLGVHLREKPSKIPFEISKRLHVRSVLSKSKSGSTKRKSLNKNLILGASGGKPYDNYDLFRQNHLRVPLKNYWVPIQSEMPVEKQNLHGDLLLTPIILSIVIALVFSSLLALVYLTMRSYRTSTHLHFDVVGDDQQDSGNDQELLDHSHPLHVLPDVDLPILNSAVSRQCLCHLDSELSNENSSSINNMIQDREENVFRDNQNKTFYQAHSHTIEPLNYICHSTSVPLISQLPSTTNKLDYSYNMTSYQRLSSSCCSPNTTQRPLQATTSSNDDNRSKITINMVKNPLDDLK